MAQKTQSLFVSRSLAIRDHGDGVEEAMWNEDNEIQRSLAPPGTGLPTVQAFVLRRLFFPVYCLTNSWSQALAAFEMEGQRLLGLAEPLAAAQLEQRVLVKAPMGIEDSSRYWSAAMVLEHLIEVGSRIAVGIVELTNSVAVTVKTDIADVKPKGGKGVQIIEDFRQFLQDYTQIVTEDTRDRKSRSRHPHPWFGPLNAHQWNCLGAVHQSVHRRQMERIVAGLDCKAPHGDHR